MSRIIGLLLVSLAPLVAVADPSATPHRVHHRVHRRVRPSLAAAAPGARQERAGARLSPPRKLATAVPVTSFYEAHALLVRHDLLHFQLDPIDSNPYLTSTDTAREPPPGAFLPPPRGDDMLDVARQSDRLLLFRERLHSDGSLATGLGLFGSATLLSAHAPHPVRFLFDRTVHLGPALFDSGGMGAGIGGTFR